MGYMSEQMDRARHRLSVGDYHKMADSGVFGPEDRVELIEGEIVDMAPIGSQHAYVVNQLARLFTLSAGDTCLVSVQNPIRLGDRSEPQSDLVLLRSGDYMSRLPEPADILLLVEVAGSSIDYERDVKLDLYARHGIPEVWLLDLAGGELTVCRDPADGKYQSQETPMQVRVLVRGCFRWLNGGWGRGKRGLSPLIACFWGESIYAVLDLTAQRQGGSRSNVQDDPQSPARLAERSCLCAS